MENTVFSAGVQQAAANICPFDMAMLVFYIKSNVTAGTLRTIRHRWRKCKALNRSVTLMVLGSLKICRGSAHGRDPVHAGSHASIGPIHYLKCTVTDNGQIASGLQAGKVTLYKACNP